MPVYRSAQGKMIDISHLAAKNEKVRAVGNMNVNARGDVVDSNNNVIKDNTRRVKSSYQKIVNNNQIRDTQPVPKKQEVVKPSQVEELSQAEKELFDNDEDVEK